jgi:SAM-dependent methyltransferase
VGFDRWVATSLPAGAHTLNVGAGSNRSGSLRRVRERSTRLVGVDPSPRVHDNAELDESHQMTLEEFAQDHVDEFDLAFAVFVLEHVDRPVDFVEACARVLRPGGTLMAMTVNKWQWFGLSTWAATRLGVSEWLLRRLRSEQAVAGYHFPTEYRLNTVRTVSSLLEDAGFSRVEFRMWDKPSMYTPYLPRPMKGAAYAYNKAAYALGNPQLMGHLTFKATLSG